uniref:Uncharacterized protein n=1 Tax=Spongospora subterranea TaxID=70186 RepID=A0A0H5QR29_9EUKA|eukprot:CRZ04528.1 hypothetical protein [Spongospora subterranea]
MLSQIPECVSESEIVRILDFLKTAKGSDPVIIANQDSGLSDDATLYQAQMGARGLPDTNERKALLSFQREMVEYFEIVNVLVIVDGIVSDFINYLKHDLPKYH